MRTTYFALFIVSHTMNLLLEPDRKKGSKYQLKFFKDPQVIKKQKNHSYVRYTSTPFKFGHGGVSATQSSIQTTVITESEDSVMLIVAELDEHNNWIDTGDNEPLYQAYLDHISKEVIGKHLKRDRPKGVSLKICTILKS